MTCRDARQYLLGFLDNELDSALSIEVQRHLEQCHDCAREAEIERTIRHQLAVKLEASAALGDDVGSLETAVRRAAHAGRMRTALPSSRARLVAVTAAAVIVAGSTWLVMRNSSGDRTADGLAHALISDFQEFQAQGRPLQFASSDSAAASVWLAETTALRLTLPSLDATGTRLLGARRCVIRGRPAALAVYELGGELASLFTLAAVPGDVEAMDRVERNGHTHWVDRCQGHTVMACRRGDLIYAAVSALPAERLAPLMSVARD